MANDFYLSFGSNARPFAEDLVKQLTPARRMVRGLIADLEKLNGTSASPTVSGLSGGTAAPTGAGAVEPAEIASGAREMGQHLASATAELEGFMSRLGSMVARIDQAGDAFKAAVAKQNRSVAQAERDANPETASLRNNGRFATAEQGGVLVDPKGKPLGQQTIAGTARIMVDEAAFNRVVQAVERNVDATKAVEQAINRLNARGGTSGGGGEATAALAEAAGVDPKIQAAVQAAVQAQLSALNAETTEIEADTKDRKQSRAEKKAERQAAAAAEREGRLPAQERADRRRDIELAGSEEALRGLQKRDLRRIAGTFTAEGYDTPYNTKTTRDQFVQSILASRQQYEAAGEVTKNDLTVSAKVVATEVSKAVRPMVDAILKAAQSLESEEGAYATRRLDRLTGGQDTRIRDAAGRERIQRGQVQRGAAFGGELDQVITKAEQTIAARNERISNAAIDQALRLGQRPGFNPYSPELRQGIQGRGQEAADARFGLAKLTAATAAMDKVGAEVIELDARLNKAQRSLAAMTREADYLANKAKLSGDEVARYTQLLRQIPQQQARLESHQARLGDIQGSEAFLTPEFRQGLRARQESQQAYAQAREAVAQRRAAEKATSPFQAALDALIGPATGLGSASGQRAQFTRLLPGLTTRGRGATRGLAFADQGRDPADLEPLDKAFRKYGQALRALEAEKAGDADPDKLAELNREMAQRLHNIIEAYERALGVRLPTGEVDGLRTYGRAQQVQADQEQKKANQRAQAAEARQRRKAREVGANLIDPATLTAESLREEYAKQRASQKRLGGRPGRAGSEDLAGPSSTAERDARELASARETLARSGVRFSQTLNSSLNGAKTLDDLIKRLGDAIREGTLQISAYHPRSKTEPGVIGSYADVAARTGNFGADPAVLRELVESVTSRGTKTAAQPAARAAASTPEQDAAFTEVNQLRKQIDQRRRLAALRKELARTQAGEEFNPELFAKAAAGSKTFTALGKKTGYTGEDYEARIQKAISSLTEDLKGVPRVRQLEAQLTEAIARTGTPDGRRPTGAGGGGRGSGGGTTAGAAEPGGGRGGRNDDRIVQVLNAIHATIKAGIKLTPARPARARAAAETAVSPRAAAPATRAEAAQQQAEQALAKARQNREQVHRQVEQATQQERANLAAAKQTRIQASPGDREAAIRAEAEAARSLRAVSEPLIQARKAETDAEASLQAATAALAQAREAAAQQQQRSGGGAARPTPQYSTKAGRESFVSGLEPQMQALVRSEDKVAAAAALVTKGILSQRDALAFFRSELKQDADAAAEFANRVRSAVGDTRLSSRSRAEAERQRRQAKLDAAGTPQAAAQARVLGAQQGLLANTMDGLSQATVAEVANLKQLVTAGADAVKVGQQMVRVYSALSAELGPKGFSAAQIKQRAKNVYQQEAGLNVGMTELRGVAQIAKASEPALKDQGARMGTTLRESAGGFFGNQGFWSRVIHSTGTFIVRNFSAGLVFGVTNALQDAVSQAIETEATFVRVSSSLEATGRSTAGLRSELQSISSDYGVALQDVYESTAGLVGLFDQPHELAGAARIVTQLQSISRGALNAQEGIASLASITSSFGDLRNLEGLKHVGDVLTVIQERAGVNVEVTAEGVARLSGLAKQVGLTFDQTAVFVAEVAKKTGQSGEAAGEQLSRVIASMQTGRGRGALISELPGTGIEQALNARQYGDALTILMQRYGSLSKAQQDNIAITLGGQRQAATINALLLDGAKNLDLVREAEDAKGQTDRRSAQLAKTLAGELKIFQANVVTLAAALFRSGIADFFGLMLKIINDVLGVTAKLVSGFSDLADKTPLTHWLKTATVGMVGFAIAISLVRKAIGGLRDAIGRGGLETAIETVPAATRRLPTELQIEPPYNPQTRQYSAPIGPALPPGTTVAGTGAGRVTDFYNQRAAQTSTRAEQLQVYAQQKATEAEQRSARFAEANARRGAAALSNVPTRALQGGAVVASKALDRVTTGLTTLASGGLAATAGLTAATLALGFLVTDIGRRADLSRRQVEAYQARFGGPVPTQPGDQALPYVGPNTDIAREAAKKSGFTLRTSAIARDWEEGWKTFLAHPISGAPEAWGRDIDMVKALFGKGKGVQQVRGDLTKDVQDRLTQQIGTATGQLQGAQPNPYVTMLLGQNTVTGNIKEAQEKSKATLKAMADEIQNNKDLSAESKAAAIAQIEKAQNDLADMAKHFILIAQGLGDANALNETQIGQVNEQLSLYRGFGGRRPDEAYALAIQNSIGDIGFSDSSTIKPLLERMSKGGQTKGQEIAGEIEAVKNNVNNYQAQYQALRSSGSADKEEIAQAFTNYVQAHNQLMQLYDEQVANLISEANLLSTAFANKGQYGAAAGQIDKVIAELRRKAAEPGLAPDKVAELNNQAEQLGEQSTQLRVTEATQGLQTVKSRTAGSEANARLEVQIAKATLDVTKKQAAAGKATSAQVAEAQQSYNQALQSGAQAAQQGIQAGYTLQSAQTLNSLSKAQVEHAAALQALAFAEQTYGRSSSEYKAALAQAVQSGQAVSQASQDLTQSFYQLRAAQTNDPAAKAAIEMQGAAQAAQFAAAQYGQNSVQYNQALASLWSARLSYAQAEQDTRQSEFAVQAARTLNAVAKANIDAAAARQAYQFALGQGNRAAANQALVQQIQAEQAARQARQEQQAAARETKVTRLAPGDAVAIARQRLANARAAQQDARQFGTASTQYQQATQQVIEAVRAAQDAVDDVMKANYNLATALAEAAGRTVDAARLRYAEARKEWLIALRKSGGRQTADVKNAKAAEAQAGAAYRDAMLQDQLDTIDFNQQMGTLTSQGAIAALQKILKATNLTQQQRRDIMLKIKGLQDDLRESLTSSGFNIPDQIKLPTPYEVRKSLGIDKYIKNFRPILNKAIGINSISTLSANQLNASAAPAAVAPTTSGASSSSVVAALDSVRQAVVANGAQVTNDIAITNQVSTPAMVEAVARRVVELISTSTAMGARANQASPKLVSY